MNRIGIFHVNTDQLTFERMHNGTYDDPAIAAYHRMVAEKLRDRGYFPTQASMVMELALPPQQIRVADVRSSLRLLARYVNDQPPNITGIFGVTHLARYAQRYGFEVVDEGMPPEKIAVASAWGLREAPATRNLFSKPGLTELEKEEAHDKFAFRVMKALRTVRPVAISREELIRRYLHSE